jgi:hypothetical protein
VVLLLAVESEATRFDFIGGESVDADVKLKQELGTPADVFARARQLLIAGEGPSSCPN